MRLPTLKRGSWMIIWSLSWLSSSRTSALFLFYWYICTWNPQEISWLAHYCFCKQGSKARGATHQELDPFSISTTANRPAGRTPDSYMFYISVQFWVRTRRFWKSFSSFLLQNREIMDTLPPALRQTLACNMNKAMFSKVIRPCSQRTLCSSCCSAEKWAISQLIPYAKKGLPAE